MKKGHKQIGQDAAAPAACQPHDHPPPNTLAAFTEQALAAFATAQPKCLCATRTYTLSGHAFQLSFANQALVDRLTPALAHLAVAEPPADPSTALTIYIWDSASTGVALPPMPSSLQGRTAPAQAWGTYSHTPTHQAFFQPAHQVLSLIDQTRNIGIYWTADADHLPIYEGGAPLLLLLHWWLGQHQRQIIHAAAVGNATGAVILVGKGGSGKSTTALCCLNEGMFYLGDDYCLLSVTDAPLVYSLYTSGKLYKADLGRFPRLQQALTTAPYAYADKSLYFFHDTLAAQLAHQRPLRAVLIPTITDGRNCYLQPASPAAALVALAPSTTFQLCGNQRYTVQQLSQVLRQVPAYTLVLGTDLTQIPPLIANLLACA